MSSASHEMDTDDRADDRDREPTRGPWAASPLGLFLVVEVLCTGTLIAFFLL